ncbi:hypothetical protein [Catellatospora tritici]|uniref:hypothetical protein n=1 Tax=Catellatospora tritici TaxID=2851566 RepID=UPI001C2DDB10|nr:hypothetical protein [Catellatospora tritici]MBV1849331.1 hypothetical protein [Catellatospora tritici]
MTVHDLVQQLPPADTLLHRCRAFALLDAVFDQRYRRHTFAAAWGPRGVPLAGMDNYSGDEYTIVFDPSGVLLLGFDHESPATPWRDDDHEHWPGLLDGVPDPLTGYLREPAFLFEDFLDVTVVAWLETGDRTWRHGPVDFSELLDEDTPDPDGSAHLFGLLADGSATAYVEFAADYFGRNVDAVAVAAVLAGQPLRPEIVAALAPEADFAAVAVDALAMGYPLAPSGDRQPS